MKIRPYKRQKPAAQVFIGRKCRIMVLDVQEKNPPEAFSIEMLPDEILVIILSCLAIKEAARASVLSRRWRYLWRFRSSDIVFEFQRLNAEDGFPTEFSESLNLVNRVMALHQGPSLDKLVIRFTAPTHVRPDITAHDSPDIVPFCDWISFAMQKKVRVLELSCFGYDLIDLDKFLSISRSKEPQNSLASLNSLTLVGFNIKDGIIEYLLSICPHLEHLSLKGGKFHCNLTISSSSLKSLRLWTCNNLCRLTISAANLVSFAYLEHWRKMPEVCFQNVPVLSEVMMNGNSMRKFFSGPGHKVHRSQLVKLVLTLSSKDILNMMYLSYRDIPRLRRLKHLELVITVVPGTTLILCVFWVMASSFLSTLSVQFSEQTSCRYKDLAKIQWELPYQRECAQKQLIKYRHKRLKQVKLIDFDGHESHIEFVMDLLQIAKSLEKLVIHPKRDVNGVGSIEDYVKQLEANLPTGAELVIHN